MTRFRYFQPATLALITFGTQLYAVASGQETAVVPPDSAVSKPMMKLEGKAELNTLRDEKAAALAAQAYKQGVAALNSRNGQLAADCFKRAGDLFEAVIGDEKYLAESRYAEAQSRRLIGQTDAASKLYQAAVDLFQEYDPLSPYLKGALDSLKKTNPKLTGKVDQAEARLQAMKNPTKVMLVDRNIVLKGGVTDSGPIRLIAEKATSDVATAYVTKNVHQAFIKMTCLETAELGSNYNTADARWLPLIANGKTVTLSASSDYLAPMISVKLNGKMYNVVIDLPDLTATKKTVFLLTDGRSIIAIDPSTEDVWLMVTKFKGTDATFVWKKLNHKKDKPLGPRLTPVSQESH
jgi:hypothetical protein